MKKKNKKFPTTSFLLITSKGDCYRHDSLEKLEDFLNSNQLIWMELKSGCATLYTAQDNKLVEVSRVVVCIGIPDSVKN